MDKLPPEITTIIVSFLPVRDESGTLTRPSLAAVSRRWQQAVEPFTFDGPFKIKSDEFELFKQTFPPPPSRNDNSLSSRRCSLLKELHVTIVLSPYSDEDCAKYETDQDRATNSRIARAGVSDLLQMLSEWPADGNLSLQLAMHSPMDPSQRDRDKVMERYWAVEGGRRQDLFSQRFRYSYIDLMDHQGQSDFPSVPCVTLFDRFNNNRHIDPRSLVALTEAFPRLKSVAWTHTMAWPFIALQRQHMQQFSDAITTFNLPQSCKELCVKFEPEYGVPDNKRMPDFSREDFCGALRALLDRSPHLEGFEYEGPADPSLFWPNIPFGTAAPAPFHDEAPWPSSSLTNIRVLFFKYNFWGQWYFGEDSNDGFGEYGLDRNSGPLPPAPGATREHLPPGYYGDDDDDDELSSTSSIATVATAAETGHERALALLAEMEMPQEWEGSSHPALCRGTPRNLTFKPLLASVARRLAVHGGGGCPTSSSSSSSPLRFNFNVSSVRPLPDADCGFVYLEYAPPGDAWDGLDNLILNDGRDDEAHESHEEDQAAAAVVMQRGGGGGTAAATLRSQDPPWKRARVAIQFANWQNSAEVISSLMMNGHGGEEDGENVMDLFHDIGKDRCGYDAIVVIIPFECF